MILKSNGLAPQTDELVRWLLRLSGAVRIGLPNSGFPDQAESWLEREGLARRVRGKYVHALPSQVQ